MRMMPAKARGAAAKSYASRINKCLGWNKSAAELLYFESPTELVVIVDATHDHSTVSALQLSRSLTLVAVRRPKSRKMDVGTGPSIKVEMNDELVLRGLPYILVSVAAMKGGKNVLAARHARDKLAPIIRGERQALIAASEALKAGLLPLVQRKAEQNRLSRRTHNAIVQLQSVWRGMLLRRATAGLRAAHRAKVRAGKLRSRKLMASLLAACHSEPICTSACFAPTDPEEAASNAGRHQEWVHDNPAIAMRYAALTEQRRSHTASLNRMLASAPEAKKRKGANEALPLSPLALLLSQSLELTAMVPSTEGRF